MWYNSLRKWGIKIIWPSQESQKNHLWMSTLIHDKKKKEKEISEQSGYEGNISQPNTSCIQQPHSQYIQQWKGESFSSNIRNKTRITTLTTFIEQKGSGFGEIFLKMQKDWICLNANRKEPARRERIQIEKKEETVPEKVIGKGSMGQAERFTLDKKRALLLQQNERENKGCGCS